LKQFRLREAEQSLDKINNLRNQKLFGGKISATVVAAEKAMVGQPAPDFEMASTKNIEKLNEPVKLADYRGKWLVMVFYPLDFTFVCPTELTTFSDRYQDFE